MEGERDMEWCSSEGWRERGIWNGAVVRDGGREGYGMVQ